MGNDSHLFIKVFLVILVIPAIALACSQDTAINYLKDKKYSKAFPCLDALAKAGSSTGQYFLGRMYELGLHVSRNSTRALGLYKSSGFKGNDHARLKVGLFYLGGYGVDYNAILAYAWIYTARKLPEAMGHLANLEKIMSTGMRLQSITISYLIEDGV